MSEQYLEVQAAIDIARNVFSEGLLDAISEIADSYHDWTPQYRAVMVAVISTMLNDWSGTERKMHEACVQRESEVPTMEVEQ